VTDKCAEIHGVPCDEEVVVLDPALDAALPAGDLVELGDALELFYRFSDGKDYVHAFKAAKVYVAGPSILYIVGELDVTGDGIVGG
tara:strand:- start:1233 stop:1490 length:258 start_codon:yes stop_codon:yes gene_type:complete